MNMANPYLPRIHGSQKPVPGHLKQSHHHDVQPEYQQPSRPSKADMMSKRTGSRHQSPHMQFPRDQLQPSSAPFFTRGYSTDYDPSHNNFSPQQDSKMRKRREKSLEREAESKKMKKAKSAKKKSKSFDESMDPLPLLTLPRVELWCRDPHCQYTKYQNHSHCNNSSSSSSGRNSIATNSSTGNGSGSGGYPGKISRSRMSNNTTSTLISGSSHSSTALPLPSDTTATTLTLESHSSGKSTSHHGFHSGSGSGGDGDSGGETRRSFFGFGGRKKTSGNNNASGNSKQTSNHNQSQGFRRENSSFEGSRRSFLHAYTHYNHDHEPPSSFDSAIQDSGSGSSVSTNVHNERGGGGGGIGVGVTRSSRAANALANSLATLPMDNKSQISSPPSTGMLRGGIPSHHPNYSNGLPVPIQSHQNPNQSQLCTPCGCNHQCQQSQGQQNPLQLPLTLPNSGSIEEDGGETGNKVEAMNSFWHLNNVGGFQSTLKRDASFHSYGGFTLNGHPGYNKHPNKMGRFCSSHKIALVVSTFSLFVTIGLVITLLFMKNKGMMEAMK